MKNSLMKKIIVLLVVLAMMISFGACGKKVEEGESATTTATTVQETTQSEQVIDPMAKYDPPITVESTMTVGGSTVFEDGDDINNNVWTRAYAEELGINLKYKWAVDGEQSLQKMQLAISTGEIPDIFVVDHQMRKQLAEGNMIWDLTDTYEKYATDETKNMFTQDPTAWMSSHINGKLMGLPIIQGNAAESANVLFIRNDWLQKLGLEAPKTVDDLINIARAFKTKDPDGNGKDDTGGLAVTKWLHSSIGSLTGFFNAFHAYPGGYRDEFYFERDGKVVIGSTQPEMKQALQVLQALKKEGLIDAEFAVKDHEVVGQEILAGKYGIFYGAWWSPGYPLLYQVKENAAADWKAYPNVSVDGKQPLYSYRDTTNAFVVVNKNFKNPEAAVKLMNFWNDIVINKDKEKLIKYIFNPEKPTIEIYKYTAFYGWEPNKALNQYKVINEILKGGDTSKMDAETALEYDNIQKWLKDKNPDGWPSYAQLGPDGSYKIIADVINGQSMVNVFYGPPTPVMSERLEAIAAMRVEAFTNIILGQDINTFDKFVQDFNAAGGTEIAQEVDAFYKANK